MRSRGSSLPREVWRSGFRAAALRTWASRVQGVDLFEHRRAVGGELRRTGLSWVCRIAMAAPFSGFR
jgi:hypothetical protein